MYVDIRFVSSPTLNTPSRVSFNIPRGSLRSAASCQRVIASAPPLQPRHWGNAARCGVHFERRNQANLGTMMMIFLFLIISTEVISFNVDRYAIKRTGDRSPLIISAKPTTLVDEAENHHFTGKNQNQREFTGER
jgi:hypothetical protein